MMVCKHDGMPVYKKKNWWYHDSGMTVTNTRARDVIEVDSESLTVIPTAPGIQEVPLPFNHGKG